MYVRREGSKEREGPCSWGTLERQSWSNNHFRVWSLSLSSSFIFAVACICVSSIVVISSRQLQSFSFCVACEQRQRNNDNNDKVRLTNKQTNKVSFENVRGSVKGYNDYVNMNLVPMPIVWTSWKRSLHAYGMRNSLKCVMLRHDVHE